MRTSNSQIRSCSFLISCSFVEISPWWESCRLICLSYFLHAQVTCDQKLTQRAQCTCSCSGLLPSFSAQLPSLPALWARPSKIAPSRAGGSSLLLSPRCCPLAAPQSQTLSRPNTAVSEAWLLTLELAWLNWCCCNVSCNLSFSSYSFKYLLLVY